MTWDDKIREGREKVIGGCCCCRVYCRTDTIFNLLNSLQDDIMLNFARDSFRLRHFVQAAPPSRTGRSVPSRRVSSLRETVYAATSTSTGSRASGTSATKEGNVNLKMELPKEMGGSKGPEGGAANPEQLFGMAYGTCFLSALGASQSQLNPDLKPLPKSTTVRSTISIGKPQKLPGFQLAVFIEVLKGPLKEAGLDDAGMKKLVEASHQLCPYSRAVKGNVEVQIKLVDA